MKKLLDANDPFFAPVWRRWVVAVAPALWAVVEFFSGDPFWGILFLAAGGYALWELIIKPARDR